MTGGDTSPSERWNHGVDHAVTEGRQQIVSPVTLLRRSGRVGDAEVVSAARYYADYSFGVCGARDDGRGGSGGGVDGYNIAAIEALGRHLDVGRALGPGVADLLNAHVVLEISIRAAYGAGRRNQAGSMALADALKALTEHYAAVDKARPGCGGRIRAIIVAGQDTNVLDKPEQI